MSAQRAATYLLFCTAIITLLLLSALNIESYLAPKDILGVRTTISEADSIEVDFWKTFLEANPDYIPGWIEIGRWDKVRQIDPNYLPR